MKKIYLYLSITILSISCMSNAMIFMPRRFYGSNPANGNKNNPHYTPLRIWHPSDKPLTTDQMINILPYLSIDNKKRDAINTLIERTKSLTDHKEETQLRLQKIFRIPWGLTRNSKVNFKAIQPLLDKKIFGMKAAKESILDELALREINPEGTGDTICFVGKPGTGKTALAEIIAETLGLSYGHIALAGTNDERAIRGSLGIYKEACEGEVAKILISCGVLNPVIILDEIDKVSPGNAQSTLLQLLDPTQNNNFFDNYLSIPLDASKITFIATANYIENLSPPLKNRLRIIPVHAYTIEEKIEITEKFILPKLNRSTGLQNHKVPLFLTKDVIKQIITHHTQEESGVRQLEKMIRVLCAKQAREVLTKKKPIIVTKENLPIYLAIVAQNDADLKKLIW